MLVKPGNASNVAGRSHSRQGEERREHELQTPRNEAKNQETLQQPQDGELGPHVQGAHVIAVSGAAEKLAWS